MNRSRTQVFKLVHTHKQYLAVIEKRICSWLWNKNEDAQHNCVLVHLACQHGACTTQLRQDNIMAADVADGFADLDSQVLCTLHGGFCVIL